MSQPLNLTTVPDSNIPILTLPNGMIFAAGGDESNCTLKYCPVELSIYGYRPALADSITMIVLYALCLVVQLGLGIKYKTWTFMGAMILGCIDEILGYLGRILMWHNPWGQQGFILQIVTITIGPVFFSAAIYVLLSQIVLYINPAASRFRPKFFYYIFIPSDILSLILQAVGGAMSSTSNGANNNGVNIALAGLSLQVATLFFFTVACIDYAFLSRKTWTQHPLPGRFKVFVLALIAALVFVYIRCCYRVYELNEGYSRTSAALRDEGLFIGLESVMIILAAWFLVIAHPGIAFGAHFREHKQPYTSTDSHEKRMDGSE